MQRSSKIKLRVGFILALSLILDISNHHNTYATSSVAITVPASIDLTILPNDNGNTSISTNELSIKTAQTEGFRILVNGNSNTLTNQHHSEVISSITANTTLGNLPTNSFGIYLGATSPTNSSTLSPLSTTPTELVHNELANASGTYKLTIGAKVDTSLPAGLYSNELVISVVADPVKVFSGITYMQDMTSDICAAAEENDTMQLIDKRDGKSYWVAKLKDGNCWMTQNLALDITEDGLSATDTDIEEDWNQSSKYPPEKTLSSITNATHGDKSTASWNFGKYVMAMPLQTSSCQTANIASCTAVDFVDVSKDGWKPGFTAQNGSYKGKTGYVAVDESTKTYDAHYLVGNYYQHNTALAGTDTSTGGPSSESICPKGWQLPPIAYGNWSYNGTIYYMMNLYGLGNSFSNASYNLAKSPLYYVRAGYVNSAYPAIWLLGNDIRLWLDGNSYDDYGYILKASLDSVSSTNGTNHWVGASMRCRIMSTSK